MLGYKNREVAQSRSEVYYNLHKHCFSVKQSGLVVLHTNTVYMEDVTFHVSEAGRQRVLAEGRKNVHATVRGEFLHKPKLEVVDEMFKEGMREAYYNPHNVSTFVDKETGEPLHKASFVLLENKKIFYK